MKIGDLFLGLQVDSADFKAQVVKATGDAGTAGATSFSSKFANVGKGIVQGVGLAIGSMATTALMQAPTMLIDKFGEAVDLASDKAENLSKARIVFGDLAASVEAFAQTTARDFGISESAALAAMGTYGAMFQAMGLGVEDSRQLSEQTLILAADLGSFNNIEPNIMLEKLRAALTGEYEPMKALGVVLNEATIKAAAFAMGIGDGIRPLSAAEKAQAVYAEVVRQTADAQGDAIRTGEAYAGKQREMAALQEEAWTRLGEAILPLAATIMPMLAEAGIAIVTAVTDIIAGVKKWIDENQGLIDTLRPMAPFLVGVVGAIVAFRVASTGMNIVNNLVTPLLSFTKALVGLIPKLAATTAAVWANVAATHAAGGLSGTLSTAWHALSLPGSSVIKASSLAGRAAGVAFGIAAAAGAIFIGAELGEQFWRIVAETPAKLSALIKEQLAQALGGDVAAWSEPLRTGMADAITMAMTEAYAQSPDLELAKQAGQNAALRYYDGVMVGITEAQPEARAAFDAAWDAAINAGATYETARAAGATAIVGLVEVVKAGEPALGAAGEELGGTTATGVVTGFQARWPPGTAFEVIAKDLHDEMVKAHQEAAWGGAQTPGEFSQGLRSAFDKVRTAFTDLKDLMKNTLSPIKQETELIGIATSERLAKALKDGRPEVRGEAQQIALETIAELHKLNPASTQIGTLTTRLLASALPNERPALQDAIDKIVGVVKNPLIKLGEDSYGYGSTIGGRFVGGIKAALAQGYKSTKDAFLDYKSLMATNSPPPPGNVFYGIDKWAANTWDAWTDSSLKAIGLGRDRVQGALSGMSMLAPGGLALPSLSGINGLQTIRHEHDHQIGLNAAAVQALRTAGYDEDAVGRAIARWVTDEGSGSGLRWSPSG